MNWRKPLIYFLLYTAGSKIPEYLRQIKQYEYMSKEDIKKLTNRKLKKLLLHAYSNVPYYREILDQAGLIDKGEVRLENFSRIPFLTREIIRKEQKNLYSKDYKTRKPYGNTSGGSTGEPVRFIQDKEYDEWNIANKIYYKMFGGQGVGDKEFRLWGSERDLLKGKEKFPIKLKNWLYNRTELNAFKMTEESMAVFVNKINRTKPTWIEAYVQPMYEFAKFIKNNNLKIYSPKGVLTSAGTLFPEIKDLIEEVFACKTFNRYGTREVGDVACNCKKQEGLHLSTWNSYIEILNDKMTPTEPGKIGKVYVTTLNNYSMPLIRYNIGDMAITGRNQKCSCGRGTPIIEKVVGRHMEVFKTKRGKIVPAEFFIHFIGVVYNKDYIKRFQVIQEDYDHIVIKLVVMDDRKFNEYKSAIINSIKKVMGKDCKIDFEFVDEIPATTSGKYLYTISKIT